MKNLIQGQARFSNSPDCPIIGQIEYGEKSIDDIDICDIFHETKEQRHERVTKRYNKMLEEKSERFLQGFDKAYNLRVVNYPCGQQIVYYTNPVEYHGKPHENLSRAYQNRERTDEERKHCIAVSLKRTKNTIYNIARSHEWKWFVTFTFNREKTDASDFDGVMKKMSVNLRNTKQRKCPNLKYIVVPELHADKTN